MKALVAAIAAIVIVIAGILVFKGDHKNSTGSENTTTPTQSQTQTATNPKPAAKKSKATITFSDSGFSPSTLTVKSGDTVTIENDSSSDIQFDSNPHPVHTDDQDLNVGVVRAGQSVQFTVTQKGTFGYHDHLDPSMGGTIVIE